MEKIGAVVVMMALVVTMAAVLRLLWRGYKGGDTRPGRRRLLVVAVCCAAVVIVDGIRLLLH